MRHPTRTTVVVAAALTVLATLLLVAAGPALAKKPPKPPPEPPPPVDEGTVYSLAWTGSAFAVKTMNPDGSGQAYLASGVYPFLDAGAPCEPSVALHGGERWFLQLRDVGGGHREVFAVNESATVVRQLTDAPDLVVEPLSVGWPSCLRWATRNGTVVDGKISYLAKMTSGTTVVEWGIYVLNVDPDNLASHAASAPTELPLSVILSPNGTINALYDWSPDGSSVVYRLPNPTRGLWKATGPSWTPTQLVSDEDCRMPRWLSGNRILFRLYSGRTDSIATDGSDRRTVVAPGSSETVGWCFGSPNGTHVVYNLFDSRRKSKQLQREGHYEILRRTVGGGDATNLTGGSNDDQFPLGWR